MDAGRLLVAALLWPLDRLPPGLALVLIAVACGLVMLLVVGRTTPQRQLRRARERMAAAIYEIRLYPDRPARILAAQVRLLGWSGIYLACLLPALPLICAPLALLYGPLEARFGLLPLPLDQPVVLRVELVGPPAALSRPRAEAVDLAVSAAVTLAGPPVLAADEGAVYLALRLLRPGDHEITLRGRGWQVRKRLTAAPGARVVLAERRAGLAHLLAVGAESPVRGEPLAGVKVFHPERPARWLGLPLPWWLVWLLVATATAMALRRRFRVAL